MKNNTVFSDSVVKKYGIRICRVAQQFQVRPEDVKRDPENYWVYPDGKPISMYMRRVILEREYRRKKKENAESLEITIRKQANKVLNLKTEGVRLPGERPPMEIRDVKDEKPINSEMFFFMVGLAIGAILTFILCTWRA